MNVFAENINLEQINESHFNDLISLFHEFALFEKLPEKMTNTMELMKEERDFFNGFIIKNNNKILGYVVFFFAYYTWSGKSLYMDDLYIIPEYRGKGFGTMLVKRVIEYAKINKCHKLRWQVSNWNEPAINFYKNLGAEINNTEMNCDILF